MAMQLADWIDVSVEAAQRHLIREGLPPNGDRAERAARREGLKGRRRTEERPRRRCRQRDIGSLTLREPLIGKWVAHLQPLALAESGGSKGKEAANEGPPPQGVETFGCLARARGEAPLADA